MPRGIEERIRWFLSNSPGGSGMCARHSWRSLGGDKGDPPAWGCPDANAVYDKVKRSGRYWTTEPPRGALVVWKYGRHGHAAISVGGGRIATTDPSSGAGRTGEESLSYPSKWGATSSARIWTDTYNGVRFPVESEDDMAWKQTYSGKPEGVFVVPCDGDYRTLDVDVPDPTVGGLENHLLYINCKPVWGWDPNDPNFRNQQVQLRIRYQRENGDETAYSDYLFTPTFETWLVTDADHWEKGEKGQGGRWQVRAVGDAVRIEIGTRYCKTTVIS